MATKPRRHARREQKQEARDRQLRERLADLLARKGLRRPEYVARELGITVEAARQLMFGEGEE